MDSHSQSNVKIAIISNSGPNINIDTIAIGKTSYPLTENMSSHTTFSCKKSQELNKKKITVMKNKIKNSSNLNNSNNTAIINCDGNKDQLQTKKGVTIENNIKSSFKNQNNSMHKFSSKTFSNNSVKVAKLQNPKVQFTYAPTIPITTSVTVFDNSYREGGKGNFPYTATTTSTTMNQGNIGSTIYYQPHLANPHLLSYNPNQCSPQNNFEPWNPNSARFYPQGQDNCDYNSSSNRGNQSLNPYFVSHVASTNISTVGSSNKQHNMLKNKFESHVNDNGGCTSNLHSNCPPSNTTQYNNRIKNYQNYNNLTYVVTDKENSIKQLENINKLQAPYYAPMDVKFNNPIANNKCLGTKLTENKANILAAISPNDKDVKEEPSCREEIILSKSSTPTTTGYESDSSHSSCPKNSYDYIIHHEQQYPAIAHFVPNYTLTPPPDSNLYKANINNYILQQQNFACFNATSNNCNTINIYSPHKFYHQTEVSAVYLNDNPTLSLSTKRTPKKYFHGRKQWFSTLKSFHIPKNTPPDRFLIKSPLMEIKVSPKNLISGSKWDKLSSDIWNKFALYQQKEVTYRNKIFLWKYLYLTIKRQFPRYGLYLVGSTITGFGTNCSDVDMCLVHRASFTSIDTRYEAISHLNNINEYLQTLGIFDQFHLIEAKVPILRFCDSNNSLEVDLNFNNSVGIRNTHLLYCYTQLDWRLRPLVLITKLWARYHNINNAKTMTISSYSLVLMVIHFLQYGVNPPVLPCLHKLYPEKFNIILTSSEFGYVDMIEEIQPYVSKNTKSIGELFLLFLEYYTNFNYSQYAISVRTGNILPIEECKIAQSIKNDIHQWKELCIEEPFDLTNTARSVYDCETFDKIKNIFSMSRKILENTLDLEKIFSPLYPAQPPQTQNTL